MVFERITNNKAVTLRPMLFHQRSQTQSCLNRDFVNKTEPKHDHSLNTAGEDIYRELSTRGQRFYLYIDIQCSVLVLSVLYMTDHKFLFELYILANKTAKLKCYSFIPYFRLKVKTNKQICLAIARIFQYKIPNSP